MKLFKVNAVQSTRPKTWSLSYTNMVSSSLGMRVRLGVMALSMDIH